MSALLTPLHEDLINAPYADARRRCAGELFVQVLTPPYPCLGVGDLRVVRVEPAGGGTELVLTYSDYVRA